MKLKYGPVPLRELPICVFIPSFNNVQGDRYLRNLKSIFRQKYKNYRIVYVDDASPDKTGDRVMDFVKHIEFPT